MSTSIARVETGKLAKLLRLAFGSDQDGEIVAAVAALKRSLASAGLDPHYIVDAFERGAQPMTIVDHRDDPEPDADDDRSAIWFPFHRRYSLTPRDRQFIEGLTRWRGPLSINQQKWLRDVCDTLAEATA
jgi:hypothetical protein